MSIAVNDVAGQRRATRRSSHRRVSWGSRISAASDPRVSCRKTLFSHPQELSIKAITLSPDRHHMASAMKDGSVIIWDPETGCQTKRLVDKSSDDPIKCLSFSHDSQFLATARRKSIYLWDISSGKKLEANAIQRAHEQIINALAFSTENYTLVSGSVRGAKSLILWRDVLKGHEKTTLLRQISMVFSIAFSPCGDVIAVSYSSGASQMIQLWTACGERRGGLSLEHTGSIACVAFSPETRPETLVMASGSHDTTVNLYQWSSRLYEVIWRLNHSSWVRSLCFSPNGRYLVVAVGSTNPGHSQSISLMYLWDLKSGRMLCTPHRPVGAEKEGSITSIVFYDNDRFFISTDWGMILQYEIKNCQENDIVVSPNPSPRSNVSWREFRRRLWASSAFPHSVLDLTGLLSKGSHLGGGAQSEVHSAVWKQEAIALRGLGDCDCPAVVAKILRHSGANKVMKHSCAQV